MFCVLYSAYKAEKRPGRGGGGGRGAARREVETDAGVAGGPAGRGGSGAAAARADTAAAPVDAHHARRYNDMAPKLVQYQPLSPLSFVRLVKTGIASVFRTESKSTLTISAH